MASFIVFTIGHSTRSLDGFIGLLKENAVTRVVDIRTIPRSRHNPQFNADTLPWTLAEAGFGYEPMRGLGGLRRSREGSPNSGWRNASFRGFADYMQTPEFEENLRTIIHLARTEVVSLMCAEAVPWRCHRSLIADALTVSGITVKHIMGPASCRTHILTPFASVKGKRVTYPPPDKANTEDG